MSYASAMGRIHQLQMRIAAMMPPDHRSPQSFDTVLQTAQNRFSNADPAGQVTVPNPYGAPAGPVAGPGAAAAGTAVAGAAQGPLVQMGVLRYPANYTVPAATSAAKPVPPALKPHFAAAAQQHRVPQALLEGLARAESGFAPGAQSPAGAQGIMQLMPATARGLGVKDASDPLQNIQGGAKYLRQMLDRFNGDVTMALAGYNAGPGAVEKHGGIPPYAETQAYVPRVLQYAGQYGLPVPTG